MGKFAGFLKRLKKIAGYGGAILGGINDLYKNTKPFVNSVVSALPGGGYINQGLDFASKVVDKAVPYTNAFLDASERSKAIKYSDEIKRSGGNVANKLIDKHYSLFDEPVNNRQFYE